VTVEVDWAPALASGPGCVGSAAAAVSVGWLVEGGPSAEVRAVWVLHATNPRPAAATENAASARLI
jgi:hypothetical protein